MKKHYELNMQEAEMVTGGISSLVVAKASRSQIRQLIRYFRGSSCSVADGILDKVKNFFSNFVPSLRTNTGSPDSDLREERYARYYA